MKERIAPLALKFEFFDSDTMQRVPRTDVVVSIDPRVKHPTPSSCIQSRMMSDPNAMSMIYFNGRDQRGKVFPELDPNAPVSHKIKFPQQLYMTLTTNRGYYCTITAWFPKEKATLKEKEERGAINAKEKSKPENQTMSVNQLRYEEFLELQALKKRSARDAYREKGRYVEEEIMRMHENENYFSEVMVRYEKHADR